MHLSFLPTVEIFAKCAVEAPWLEIALREAGVKEVPGLEKNNPRILEYISSFPYLRDVRYLGRESKADERVHSEAEVDETAWCACFVAWCLRKAGQPTPGTTARAKDWLQFGTALSRPRLGAITVVHKHPTRSTAGMTTSGNHVAFYLRGPAHAPTLFGGNQADKVCAKTFHGYSVLGWRWPWNFQRPLPSNVA
jgi:uncharacterized protein (TIGR02594 family)